MTGVIHAPSALQLLLLAASTIGIEFAQAAARCERNLVANVVALDQPLMFNRLGAQNVNGMMFALRRDVVDDQEVSLTQGGAAVPGKVSLRPDKRPRPLVLRVAAGDCLTINLLAWQANTLIPPGATRSYTLYAEREGAFAASSRGATFGGEGAASNVAIGLFGEGSASTRCRCTSAPTKASCRPRT